MIQKRQDSPVSRELTLDTSCESSSDCQDQEPKHQPRTEPMCLHDSVLVVAKTNLFLVTGSTTWRSACSATNLPPAKDQEPGTQPQKRQRVCSVLLKRCCFVRSASDDSAGPLAYPVLSSHGALSRRDASTHEGLIFGKALNSVSRFVVFLQGGIG
ncbi:hypothetical protein K470DRAFT_259099 [Piedraia hortae CBS 480.64]|uniref:Uncharacterized protein n=1 Tax=Piedraia hortae CBS 480.64 TaxID=1314780 RepID=A0A6A7BV53_9PEZI|nr:hypothetical protein K470DRAFT_259099 [Piedraia hortae CBS 480.64]